MTVFLSDERPWELDREQFSQYRSRWASDEIETQKIAQKHQVKLVRGVYLSGDVASNKTETELFELSRLLEKQENRAAMLGAASGRTLHERIVRHAAFEGFHIPRHVLSDHANLTDTPVEAIWRDPTGKALLPQFKVSDTTSSSARQAVQPGWSVRAFRRGDWIDALSYTANRRDGLGKRIHALEWPVRPTDQMALIRGLHTTDEQAADAYFDAMRQAITEIAPVNKTGFDQPHDWWVTRLIFEPAMIARYAPQTAEVNAILDNGQAVFSVGKPDWAKTKDEFLASFTLANVAQEDQTKSLLVAEGVKHLCKTNGSTLQFIRHPKYPGSLFVFGKYHNFDAPSGYRTGFTPLAVFHDGRVFYRGRDSLAGEIASKLLRQSMDRVASFDPSFLPVLEEQHKEIVAQALSRKLPVPGNVLEDYPEFKYRLSPNLAGDDRPLPEFSTEPHAAPLFGRHGEYEEFVYELEEMVREGIHSSWDGQHLYDQAKAEVLTTHHEDYLIPFEDRYDLAQEKEWYSEIVNEVLAEKGFAPDSLDSLSDDDRDLVNETLDQRLDDRLIEEALQDPDPEDPIWDFDKDNDDNLLELFFDKVSEMASEEVRDEYGQTEVIRSITDDGERPYFILRDPDGRHFVHLSNDHSIIGSLVATRDSYQEAVQAACQHARLGFVPRSFPLNKSARQDAWGVGQILISDGTRDLAFRALGKGEFGVIMPDQAARAAYQTVHLPTGLPVGPLWLKMEEAQTFVDLLQPQMDWASIDFAKIDEVGPAVNAASDLARQKIRQASRTGRTVKNKVALKKVSPKLKEMTASGFSGPIAFSLGLFETMLPTFYEAKEQDLHLSSDDRRWLMERLEESLEEGPLKEQFLDRFLPDYTPTIQALTDLAEKSVFGWDQYSPDEKSLLLSDMQRDTSVKYDTIFADLSTERKEFLGEAFLAEIKHYQNARMIEDDAGLGYRLVFNPVLSDAGIEVYAPGPFGDETFLGIGQGETFSDALVDAADIASQYGLLGHREADQQDIFRNLNPVQNLDGWARRVLILSPHLDVSHRLVNGFARGNFGLVKTDWHLGEKQPGTAVIHLGSGLPIEPYFRTDREAMSFAELLEVQADWSQFDDHEKLRENLAELREIARNSQMTVVDSERSVREQKAQSRPRSARKAEASIAGPVAFKISDIRDPAKKIISLLDSADPSLSIERKWSDFLEMSARAFRGNTFPKDSEPWLENEDAYLEIVDRYRRSGSLDAVRTVYPEILAILTMASQRLDSDVLAQVHSEIASSKNLGQYFTPYEVARLNAEITIGDLSPDNIKKISNGKGFVTVGDPTCGSGTMAVAIAEIFHERHLDPAKDLRVYLKDIDIRAVHMAYLNMALRGIPAIVEHGNGLSDQVLSRWVTSQFLTQHARDIAQKRERVSIDNQPDLLLEKAQYSIGRDYRSLSHRLADLGAGDSSFLTRKPVPYNDEFDAQGNDVLGEAARQRSVGDLLNAANNTYHAAETLGLIERHPARSTIDFTELFDDKHQHDAMVIDRFLATEELLHPSTRKRAQDLFSYAEQYQTATENYRQNFGEIPASYDDFIKPRFKVRDLVPEFGTEDDLSLPSDFSPDAKRLSERVGIFERLLTRKVRAEYLSQHGSEYALTEETIEDHARNHREEAVRHLVHNQMDVTEEAISNAARQLVMADYRKRHISLGDLDEKAFDRDYADQISEEVSERALHIAHQQLLVEEPLCAQDKAGLGYSISHVQNDPNYKVLYAGDEIAVTGNWAEAVIFAERHSQGLSLIDLRDPTKPLNEVAGTDQFSRRKDVYFAASGKSNDIFVGIGGKLIDPVVYGHFAISKDRGGRPGWYISHLPTGFSLAAHHGRFSREEDARNCVMELEKLTNWSVVRSEQSDWIKRPELTDIKRQAIDLVEKHLENSQAELARERKPAKQKDDVSFGGIAFKTAEISDDKEKALLEHLENALETGKEFRTAAELRAFCSDVLQAPLKASDLDAKKIEELAEVALLRVARKAITAFKPESSMSERMETLQNLQAQLPSLTKRTSKSSELQAYSTPLALAYMANAFLGAAPGDSVYDPAAGHGALLLATPPENRIANEFDPVRAKHLWANQVTTEDGVAFRPPAYRHLIANPPFGSDKSRQKPLFLTEDGAQQTTRQNAVETRQLDQLIVWNALARLPEDGNAVLLMPAPSPYRMSERNPYLARSLRNFYFALYGKYNVTSHTTLVGDLYRQQGAGWPVDLIVINGRGKSSLTHPAFADLKQISNFGELKELADHVMANHLDAASAFSTDGQLHSRRTPGSDDSGVAADQREFDGRDLSRSDQGQARGDRQAVARDGAGDLSLAADRYDARGNNSASRLSGISAAGDLVPPRSPSTGNTGPSDRSGSRSDFSGDRTMSETESLVAYVPLSGGKQQKALMPANLSAAFLKAHETFKDKHGNIDDFVQEKLGYKTRGELYKALSAQQIDAVGFAISQHESGGSFINGNVMGMGKGRVAAAMLVYASRHKMTPVFFTERPNLYPAMMRDLADIGYGHLRPLVTNDGLTGSKALPLPNGETLRTNTKARHDAKLTKIRDQGHLGDDYDMVFTTWSQTSTVNGKDTLRRQVLRSLAPRAYLVRDEVHNVGGSEDLYRDPAAQENRAELARSLMYDAKGLTDSSGTYAKRPGLMDLFGRTDLRLAVQDPSQIGEIISRHGLPMQQMVATMLAESGQYLRLEKSMEGISYDFQPVTIDEKRFDQLADIIASIAEFDQQKNDLIKGPLGKKLIANGQAVVADAAVGEVGVNSINFSSILHNLADQALLAMSAETVAKDAIDVLKNGEKPFITLANTMGSFLADYSLSHELQPGDVIDANFGDLVRRYIERSRDISIGSPYGEREKRQLTDAELGPRLQAKYIEILKKIDQADWSNMPVSPIDYVKARLEKAGYSFGEFTGRADGIDYSEAPPRYYRRSAQDRSKAAAVQTEAGFNDGSIDVVLANESAASGISLHASEKVADQRPRVDMTWQAHREINTHVQLKGRVNREGQVVNPRYIHYVPNVPAAERPAAVLEAKLQSLNANTTARKTGLLKSGGINLLNDIGDRAAATVMENNPQIHYRFGLPLKATSSGRGLQTDGAARKITGRLIMLPVNDQRRIYNEIEREYRAEYQRAEAFGLLREEAQVLDLDARLLAKAKLDPSVKSTSPFGGAIFVNEMDVANLDRPYPWARIQATLNQGFGLEENGSFGELQAQGRDHARALREAMLERFAKYRAAAVKNASDRNRNQVAARLDGDRKRFETMVNNFPIGRTVALKTPDQKLIYGVVAGLKKRGSANNPLSPAAWAVKIYLADGAKTIDLRLNELALPGEKQDKSLYHLAKADEATVMVDGSLKTMPVHKAFDQLASNERETRLIATGNILAAADRFSDAEAIYFRDSQGEIQPGLLLTRGTNLQNTLETSPIAIKDKHQVATILDADIPVFATDNNLVITRIKDQNKKPVFEVRASRGRSNGGKYWLDRDIRNLAGDFVSVGSSMVATVKPEQLSDLLVLLDQKNISLIARQGLEEVRKITGVRLPEMKSVRKPLPTAGKQTAPRPNKTGGFVMPWETGSAAPAPFAKAMFSLGRPVSLIETPSGFEPVRHAGAPGKQSDGSRIHRILDVPEDVSVKDLLQRFHLNHVPGRHVHKFHQVYFSTGASNGLTLFSEEDVKAFPRHQQYDLWASRRGETPQGWIEADVPLLSPAGPVAYPGFISESAPGLAVVPFPRPGLRPGSYDLDNVRFVVLHRASGQALLPGKRFMYSGAGAAHAAQAMAREYDFDNLTSPDQMSAENRNLVTSVIETAYDGARSTDRDAWISANLAAGVGEAFQNSEVLWVSVEDATSPDLDMATESASASGVFYLHEDRDSALDAGFEDAIPVRVIPGKIADLTADPWSPEIQTISREFFDQNQDDLRLGLSTTLYERVDEYEEFDRRVAKGETADDVRENMVERELDKFDYQAFENAVRAQDYTSAGQYDGDLKDALMAWLAEGGYDSAKLWSPFEYDKTELSVFNVKHLEPAWDQLSASIEIALAERREAEQRHKQWEADRGEAEIERLRTWKASALEDFDIAVLQEQGFDPNNIHWLPVPNKEFPELDRAWKDDQPELYTRRTDAEAGKFAEAVPVYLRRGAGVDLTTSNEKSQEFVEQLRLIPGIDQSLLSQLPGGDVGTLIDFIDHQARNQSLDWVQFSRDGQTVTRLADATDVRVAWDAITRKSLHRRSSDVFVGPALAAASKAAALEAPRLMLTGPDGRDQAMENAKSASIFLQAEEVRALAGQQSLIIFVEGDQLRIFDRDARRAHDIDPDLGLIEIADMAEIAMSSDVVETLAPKLAEKFDVVVARLDDQGQIIFENYTGDQKKTETLTAADAANATKLEERAKARRQQTQAFWSDKPLSDRYEDLLVAARNREVPALQDGDRYIISGKTARDLCDDIELLAKRLDSRDITWFTDEDIPELTAAIASKDRRLMLAQGLARSGWRQTRVAAAAETQDVDQVSRAAGVADVHTELKIKHQGRIVFVRDGDSYRTFGDDVENIARQDPLLTSKFEAVGDLKSIRIEANEIAYQANQMSLRGLKVTVADFDSDGQVSLRNFDPQTDIKTEPEIAQAAAGQNREKAMARETPASARLEADSELQNEIPIDVIINVRDQAKRENPAAVILIAHKGEYFLLDGDARLVARHFQPAQSRLSTTRDDQERLRVTTSLNETVVGRASDLMRNAGADLIILKQQGDEWSATSQAATRTDVPYDPVAQDVLKRRSFDTSRTFYVPGSHVTGQIAGTPLLDGYSVYRDETAAAMVTGSSVPVYLRNTGSTAKLTAQDLGTYSWSTKLKEIYERLSPQYGFTSVEELKAILLDGNLESWWLSKMAESGIAGDPKDLQRSLFSEFKRLGHDSVLMLDANGFERQVFFDGQALYPASAVSAAQMTQTTNVQTPVSGGAPNLTIRPGNAHPAASPSFVPNRSASFTVQATPETRQDVKSLLDNLTGHLNANGMTSDDRKRFIRENGLLNRPLDGRVNRYNEDILALNFGYMLYPAPNGTWLYASTTDFLNALGPGGSLYGRWAPELGDQIADYAGIYLSQLDATFEHDLGRLKDDIAELVEQVHPGIETHFVDRLFADGRVDGESDRQPVLGLYFSDTHSMTVSTDMSRGNPKVTAAHELYHSIAALLSKNEQTVIASAFPTEEKAAEAFAKWVTGAQGSPAIDPVTNFVARMNNLLKGRGFESWQNLFSQVKAGDISARTRVLDVSSNIAFEDAVKLVDAAGLPALAETVNQYGKRLKAKDLAVEALYRLMKMHLDDMQIMTAARNAGYHRVEDQANISTIPATRRAKIVTDLERHKRLTPVEVGTNDAALVRRPQQATSAQARASQSTTGAGPAISRRPDQPHVIRFSTGQKAKNNQNEQNNSKQIMSSKESSLRASFDDADYLRSGSFAVNNANRGGSMLPEPVIQIPQRNEINTMPRGQYDAIPGRAYALYLRPSDIDQLKVDGILPSKEPLMYDQVNRLFYIERTHPKFEELFDRFGHDEARSAWRADLERRDDQYLSTANRAVPHEKRVYLHIPLEDLRRARHMGAVHDATKNQYYVPQGAPRAKDLIDDFGEQNTANFKKVRAQRNEIAASSLARVAAANDTASQVAKFSLGREVGDSLLGDVGRSALVGGSLAGGIQAAKQVNAGDLALNAQTVQDLFANLGPADWEQLSFVGADPLATPADLWDRLGAETRQQIENFVALQHEGIDNVKDFFAASVDYARNLPDAASGLVTELTNSDAFSALQQASHTFGSAVRDGMAPFAHGAVDPSTFFGSDSFLEFTREARNSLSPTMFDQARVAFASLGDRAEHLVKPLTDALGLKATAALAAIGGVGGLAVVGNVALAGGGAAAMYAAGNYLTRRNERLKNWTTVAQDAPWMLSNKQFGQVAKRLYRVNSVQTPDGIMKSLIERKSGEIVISEVVSKGKKLSTRSLVDAAHATLVDGAERSGFPVPQNVLASVKEVRQKNAPDGFVKPKISSTLKDAATERARTWSKQVPMLYAPDNSAKALKVYGAQLDKGYTPTEQFAALLRTQSAQAAERDPERKTLLKNGQELLEKFVEQKKDQTVEQVLRSSKSQNLPQSRGRRR